MQHIEKYELNIKTKVFQNIGDPSHALHLHFICTAHHSPAHLSHNTELSLEVTRQGDAVLLQLSK